MYSSDFSPSVTHTCINPSLHGENSIEDTFIRVLFIEQLKEPLLLLSSTQMKTSQQLAPLVRLTFSSASVSRLVSEFICLLRLL